MSTQPPKEEKRLTKTNPNKVNQYTEPDPRQALFLSAYTDPNSPTFGNAYQSALTAKYSEEYAHVLKGQMPDWLSENLNKLADQGRIAQAEKHIDEVLNLPILVPAMGAFGPIFQKIEKMVKVKLKNGKIKIKKKVERIPVMVNSMSVVKEKTKAAEIVLEGLAKNKYGKNGKGNGPSVKFVFNAANAKNKYQ